MSFERSYSIESHERIKLILVFGDKSLLLTWWVTYKVISTTALKAISRHLWYLGEEMVPLSLFRCRPCGNKTSHGSTFTGNTGTARIRLSINQMHCNTGSEHQTPYSFI